MNTYESLFKVLEHASLSSSLAFICISIGILSITILLSHHRAGWARFAFVVVIIGVTGHLSLVEQSELWKDYFLNISTELLGSLTAVILLSTFTIVPRSLIPFFTVTVALVFLPLEFAEQTWQPYVLNLGSELVGAFILLIIVERRHMIWRSAETVAKKRKTAFIRSKKRIREKYLVALKQELRQYEQEVMHRLNAPPTESGWNHLRLKLQRQNELSESLLQIG